MQQITEQLVEAALPHVPFDGWSDDTFRAACADLGVPESLARIHCPRAGLDLAIAAHMMGDAELARQLAASDLAAMRFRDRVIHAVMLRLAIAGDPEVVRRATTLMALPHLAPEGARLIWHTADTIWTALGDRSDDLNWYSKRATLAAIHGATVLFWLGDHSDEHAETRDFLARRIDDVMSFEGTKARLRGNPLTAPLMGLQARIAGLVRAPGRKD